MPLHSRADGVHTVEEESAKGSAEVSEFESDDQTCSQGYGKFSCPGPTSGHDYRVKSAPGQSPENKSRNNADRGKHVTPVPSEGIDLKTRNLMINTMNISANRSFVTHTCRMVGSRGFDRQSMWIGSPKKLCLHGLQQKGRFAAVTATDQFLHLKLRRCLRQSVIDGRYS